MLGQILAEAQRQALEKRARVVMATLAEQWDSETFRQAAHTYLMPQEIFPPELRKGRAAQLIQMALRAFKNEEMLAIIAQESPPHREVIEEYPDWAERFIGELRRMYSSGD